MSAPDTNLERQKTRHKTMGTGLWIGAGVAILVAAAFTIASTLGVDVTGLITAVD